MAKLTDIISNPSLAKSNRSSYCYELNIRGQKQICTSHIETVVQSLKMMAEAKVINLEDLEATERVAGFHLLLDVSDLPIDNIAKVISTQFPRYENRYACKKVLTVNKTNYIVCREWTVKRIDKFIEKFMSKINSGITDKKLISSVTRIVEDENPIVVKPVIEKVVDKTEVKPVKKVVVPSVVKTTATVHKKGIRKNKK